MKEIQKNDIDLIYNEHINNILKNKVRVFLVEDSEENIERKLNIFLKEIYGKHNIIFFAEGLDDSINEIKEGFDDNFLFYSNNGHKIINPFANIYINISKFDEIEKAIDFWTGSNPEIRCFIVTFDGNFTSISDIYINTKILILCVPSNVGYGYYIIYREENNN